MPQKAPAAEKAAAPEKTAAEKAAAEKAGKQLADEYHNKLGETLKQSEFAAKKARRIAALKRKFDDEPQSIKRANVDTLAQDDEIPM